MVSKAAVGTEQPLTRAVAPTTLVSATIEPMLRSMPPLTIIIVIPNAPVATMTVCVRMILKFAPVRK